VGDDPPAPPEGHRLHLLPLTRPHVIDPELEEEEPPSSSQDPGRLRRGPVSIALSKVAEDVEGDDGVEAPLPEGEVAGVRRDEIEDDRMVSMV